MNDIQVAQRIRLERKDMEGSKDFMHNKMLHKTILETWRRDCPKMTAHLEKFGILDDFAVVQQEKMWRAQDEYLKAGYPVTDAREQAEKDCLMLTPEEPEEPEEKQEVDNAFLN